MRIFGLALDDALLTPDERHYLQAWNPDEPPPVEAIWGAMDAAWDAVGANLEAAESGVMEAFYRHPVWLLNGIFTEMDPVSAGHRDAIAQHIAALNPSLVCDYGGGFGSLARRIATLLPQTVIQVVEPYPHKVALALAQNAPNLAYKGELPHRADVVVAQDVLEHVPHPIELTARLTAFLPQGGIFIAANCFLPVIKCHLPATFHLLQTFRHCVLPLGLNFSHVVPGAAHAEIFQRSSAIPDLPRALRREWASQRLHPFSRKLQRWAAKLL